MGSAHKTYAAMGQAMAGGMHRMRDPGNGGNIVVTEFFAECGLTTGSSQTRVLKNPRFSGQELLLHVATDGGTVTVNADGTAWNQSGHVAATMADVNDWILFRAVQTPSGPRWRIMGSEGINFA